MASNPRTLDRSAASRTDRRIYRFIGILVILVGMAIALSVVFTAFPHRVQFQWEFVDGERTPITHITCPSPWSVLVDDAAPRGVVGGELCIRPARGQVIQGVVAILIALPLGIWIFTRDTRRAPLPPLPPSVRALLRRR